MFNTKVADYVYHDEVDSIQFVDGKLIVEVNGLACTQTPGKKPGDYNIEAARLYDGATHDELDQICKFILKRPLQRKHIDLSSD